MVNEASDEVLYQRYLGGDAAAFEQLYGRYRQPLYLYLLRNGLSPAEAEDLYQDIWLGIAEVAQRFRGGHFRAWLYQVARNRRIDRQRRLQIRAATPLDAAGDPPAPLPDPAQQAHDSDCVERLVAAIDALPHDQREAFVLREESGLTLDAIAELVGVGLQTLKSRLRYAVRKLRTRLEDCL